MSEGAWIPMTDGEMLGTANGVATLDANSKVAQNIPNSKVEGLGSLALKNSLEATDIPELPNSKIPGLTTAISELTTDLASKVSNTLQINGRPLSENITLTTEDVRVANKTSLPATGQPGQIISCNGTLYIWKG
jgi:hypothetical protein